MLQANEPKTNEEREEENTAAAIEIVNEPPAESEAGEEEPNITEPIVTASPKTPLVIVKKDAAGKPEVEINPEPEVSTKEAPAVEATSSSPSVTPTVTPTVKAPVADESAESSAEPSAPESKPAVTVSGKTVDAADAPVVAKIVKKDPEVVAAKTATATADADVKKIEKVTAEAKVKKIVKVSPEAAVKKIKKVTAEAANSDDGDDKKVVAVKKVVAKVETVAQEAVKEVETILKDTELAVEKAKPLIPHKCFYIQSLGADGKGTNLYYEVSKKDKYAPRKTGAYNVDVHHGIKGSHDEKLTQ